MEVLTETEFSVLVETVAQMDSSGQEWFDDMSTDHTENGAAVHDCQIFAID